MTLERVLTYAGVPLLLDTAKVVRLPFKNHLEAEDPKTLPPLKHQPEADLIDELNRLIPFNYLEDFSIPSDYPGRNLGALAQKAKIGPHPTPHLRINDYYYPTGASRWSVFRGLATSSQVQAMLGLVQQDVRYKASNTAILKAGVTTGWYCHTLANGTTYCSQSSAQQPNDISVTGPYNSEDECTVVCNANPIITQPNAFGPLNLPATFVMVATPLGAGNLPNQVSPFRVQTQLFMLPPRPLGETFGQFDGLYLITLVDERYWWQDAPITLKIRPGMQWTDIIGFCELALGVNIFLQSPIQAAYGTPEPDSQLWVNEENAAAILDAVAYNTGRTVVRNLDGTYVLYTPLESYAQEQVNRAQANAVVRTAGGDIFQPPKQPLFAGLSPARNEVLPAVVEVTFPKYVQGDDPVPHFANTRYANQRPSAWYEDSYGDVYTVPIALASGILQQIPGNLLSSLGGTGNFNAPFVHSIHSTAKALYPSEATLLSGPANTSGLTSLATQIAFDYYHNQISTALDEVYPGTLAWVPEGIHDIVWTYSARVRQATCRVMKTQWNPNVREMQHAEVPLGIPITGIVTSGTNLGSGIIVGSGTYVSGQTFPLQTTNPRGIGGHSVAQTIRDSWNNNQIISVPIGGGPSSITYEVQVQLADKLGLQDQKALFNKVDYLPTQNRWRGQIANEAILFEGTSGGLNSGNVTTDASGIWYTHTGTLGVCFCSQDKTGSTGGPYTTQDLCLRNCGQSGYIVNIVYRGIDGSPAAPHLVGDVVRQLSPNFSHGVNLTTYEKMQWAFPQEWTSGGIQGIHIVPQMQTIYVFDGTGMLINGVPHYSGRVFTYDETQPSPVNWNAAEFAWAVERNGASPNSGLYYDGQFAAPASASGPVAPVYLINTGGSSGTSQSGCMDCGFPIYDNYRLSTLPTNDGYTVAQLQGGPPYSQSTINTLKTDFGLNFLDVAEGGSPYSPLIQSSVLWFLHQQADGSCVCSQDPTPKDNDLFVKQYPNEAACDLAIVQTCSNPGITQPGGSSGLWYCHTPNPNNGSPHCNQNPDKESPDDIVTGPWDTQDHCNCNCVQQRSKWYCHQRPTGNCCDQNADMEPGDTGNPTGPFQSLKDCTANCAQIITTSFYYCHQGPDYRICNQDPVKHGTETIQGPYQSLSLCNKNCQQGPIYSITPGITWEKWYSPGTGDTGPYKTINLRGTPSFPLPPGTTINGQPINNGGLCAPSTQPGITPANYPLNFLNTCTIQWTAHLDPICNWINVNANWGGLNVVGNNLAMPGSTCIDFVGSCSLTNSGLLDSQGDPARIDQLEFDACDFSVTAFGGTSGTGGFCPGYSKAEITTKGPTQCVQVLRGDCTPVYLIFRDGLFKGVSLT